MPSGCYERLLRIFQKRSCRTVFRFWGLVPRRLVWALRRRPWESGLSTLCDVTIVGAGPFGLSVAAHLRRLGVEHRTIGSPGNPPDRAWVNRE
ncbi:FAD-dependent monooxygenase [Bradyrhizobium sp. AUGA SZCCT0283]|uniref:FAD-dependent monooxygenase n=1 Tax=Bradyrhizobium sp. AUGA SZCCT0283 TaxID=2807671 RepID=UPI0020132C66|nr:FAD-dependent monooxygenase [Bradyrhizobium sp. AUGA SZCCT0283]